ncbi:MAG: TGS domain-containing protein [Burkholderiales bacterium]|nr:TGS domain-containing protein [Burkholderiales bacterium]
MAAHWRYKEGGAARRAGRAEAAFEAKIAWLRQLLPWRDELGRPARAAAEQHVARLLDDTIFVLTPQGKVIDLPAGSTPIDFAYARAHRALAIAAAGAKVDGADGAAQHAARRAASASRSSRRRSGGPSRDWLNPELGFVRSPRARPRLRQWFNAQALAETIAAGRAIVERELRREKAREASLEGLARRLGFAKTDDLFAAVGRDEVNLRQLQAAFARAAADGGRAGRGAARCGAPGRAPRAIARCSSSAWTG